jgi:PEP-CTERM motif
MRRSSLLMLGALAAGSFSSLSFGTTVFFDFGASSYPTAKPTNYNNFEAQNGVTEVTNSSQITLSIPNLIDSSGNPTGISASFPNSEPTVSGPNYIFGPGNNQAGSGDTANGLPALTGAAAAIFNPIATSDSWFLSTNFEAYPNPGGPDMPFLDARLTLTGLDPTSAYNFDFFASRTGSSGVRSGDYTATGLNSATAVLNAVNNTGTVVTDSNIFPTAGGTITIDVTPDSTNNNANLFTYLNAMRMTSVPEPTSLTLIGFGSLLLGRRRRA